MSDQNSTGKSESGVSTKAIELVVAALLLFIGAIVIFDSVRVGFRWADDGPQAGYFPFYIGIILCLASGWIFLQALRTHMRDAGVFVDSGSFRMVLAVLIPTGVFIAAVYVIGIYVAAALFIGGFMWWQGRFSLAKLLPVSILVPVALFLLFEVWFLVPLPKGPVEALIGY